MERVKKIRFDIARDVCNASDVPIEADVALPVGRLRLLVRKSEHLFVLPAAVDLLSRRDHGQAELRRKLLRKGFSRDGADTAIETLARRGYQNDEAAAESWIRAAMKGSGKSRSFLLSRLAERGFSREVASDAIARYEDEHPRCFEKALERTIEKVTRPLIGEGGRGVEDLTPEQRKTVITRLLRRGFSTNDIRKHFR